MDELFGVTELAKHVEEEAAERHVPTNELSLEEKLKAKHHEHELGRAPTKDNV
jgi:hypothetical protein